MGTDCTNLGSDWTKAADIGLLGSKTLCGKCGCNRSSRNELRRKVVNAPEGSPASRLCVGRARDPHEERAIYRGSNSGCGVC